LPGQGQGQGQGLALVLVLVLALMLVLVLVPVCPKLFALWSCVRSNSCQKSDQRAFPIHPHHRYYILQKEWVLVLVPVLVLVLVLVCPKLFAW
jgi:hypothetical protein